MFRSLSHRERDGAAKRAPDRASIKKKGARVRADHKSICSLPAVTLSRLFLVLRPIGLALRGATSFSRRERVGRLQET